MQDLMALAHLESEERKKKWTGTTGGHAAPVEQPRMWVSSTQGGAEAEPSREQ